MPIRKADHTGLARQHAALPFKREGEETKILLVTSRDTGRWVLPKGWAEAGLSGAQVAAKEAFEEAGIEGEVTDKAAGSYSYVKRMPRNRSLECDVQVYPMRVDNLLAIWPENKQRRREWFNLGQAAMAVDDGELVILLLKLAAPGMWGSWNVLHGTRQSRLEHVA